jgi:hypothetical protein
MCEQAFAYISRFVQHRDLRDLSHETRPSHSECKNAPRGKDASLRCYPRGRFIMSYSAVDENK